MNLPLILDVPRRRIQPKAENQVYNSIVQGMQTEISASFHLQVSEFLVAGINQNDALPITAASTLNIY